MGCALKKSSWAQISTISDSHQPTLAALGQETPRHNLLLGGFLQTDLPEQKEHEAEFESTNPIPTNIEPSFVVANPSGKNIPVLPAFSAPEVSSDLCCPNDPIAMETPTT